MSWLTVFVDVPFSSYELANNICGFRIFLPFSFPFPFDPIFLAFFLGLALKTKNPE